MLFILMKLPFSTKRVLKKSLFSVPPFTNPEYICIGVGRCPTVQQLAHRGYACHLLALNQVISHLVSGIVDVKSMETYYEEREVKVFVIECIVPAPVECRLSASDNALVCIIVYAVFVDIYIFGVTGFTLYTSPLVLPFV